MTDRRIHPLRRDLNDMIRSPEGKVSEAKAFAVAFKGVMLWIFLVKIDGILADWTLLLIFIATFLMPDLLKKVLSVKAGVQEKK